MIQRIYDYLLKYDFTTKIIDYIFFCKRKLFQRQIPEEFLHNIEWFSDYDIPRSWFYEKKPKWISWVARLKNADHFLELCMESHLPFLDELILVDNESTDRTKEICKKLQKKYPEKVKFYEYPFFTIPAWGWNDKISTNSIHSLAYHYNWCFSKAKYSHVMKVDDDNFLVEEKWKNVREKSLQSKNYNVYRWINLIKDKKWRIWTIKWYEYSWRYCDHGIYPVSPYNYYIQTEIAETFVNNLMNKRFWFSFFHLKFLKPNFWFHNITPSNYKKRYESKVENCKYEYDLDKFSKSDDVNFEEYFKQIDGF